MTGAAPLSLSAPRLLVDGELTGPGAVVVADGRVVDVLDHVPARAPGHRALDHGILTPGLVDLQVNGFAGVDLADADDPSWDAVERGLLRTGVTAYLATFITAPLPALADALARTARRRTRGPVDGARLLGAHVEGPFLSQEYRGAHDAALMRDPTPAALAELLDGSGGDALTMLTLAPEREHGLEAVRRLAARGVVVSIGHTAADAATVAAAADAGARMVTHLFNAQRPFGHRAPGVPGQAMADDRLTLGLIADLRHVAAPVVLVAMRACPDRVALVTDAVAAAGMPPGSYRLGGEVVVVSDEDLVPRRTDGTIAGSSLTLDAAVRNVVAQGIDAAAALRAATSVPADVLGRHDVGRLAPGARADLVWWDDELTVRATWVGGHSVPVVD